MQFNKLVPARALKAAKAAHSAADAALESSIALDQCPDRKRFDAARSALAALRAAILTAERAAHLCRGTRSRESLRVEMLLPTLRHCRQVAKLVQDAVDSAVLQETTPPASLDLPELELAFDPLPLFDPAPQSDAPQAISQDAMLATPDFTEAEYMAILRGTDPVAYAAIMQARRDAARQYAKSKQGKSARSKYAQSAAGKAARARATAKYAKTEASKAARAKYAQSDAGKAARARAAAKYAQSEAGKQARARAAAKQVEKRKMKKIVNNA